MSTQEDATGIARAQAVPRKPIETERQTVREYRKRPHTSPATMFPPERTGVVGEVRAGRNFIQTARAYHAEPYVIDELAWRNHETRLAELECTMRSWGPAAQRVA